MGGSILDFQGDLAILKAGFNRLRNIGGTLVTQHMYHINSYCDSGRGKKKTSNIDASSGGNGESAENSQGLGQAYPGADRTVNQQQSRLGCICRLHKETSPVLCNPLTVRKHLQRKRKAQGNSIAAGARKRDSEIKRK